MYVILLNYNQVPTTLSVILILSHINPIKSHVYSSSLIFSNHLPKSNALLDIQ